MDVKYLCKYVLQFQCWTLRQIRYRGHDVQHGTRTDLSISDQQSFLGTRTDPPSSEQAFSEVSISEQTLFLGTRTDPLLAKAFPEVSISEQTFSGTVIDPSFEQVFLDGNQETESILNVPQAFLHSWMVFLLETSSRAAGHRVIRQKRRGGRRLNLPSVER